MDKIRIGIVGYGNLGRGVQYAASQNKDMEVVGGIHPQRPRRRADGFCPSRWNGMTPCANTSAR